VRVAYCEAGNYRRVAEQLLGACRAELPGATIVGELEPGRGGVFEVYVAGQLVHSKKATSRLPEDDEIFYHLRAALPAR
jgi:selT/selW/selH-like putative selenoprotein